MPVYDMRTLESHLAQNRLTIFAAIALVLASVGLYAVIAHSVSRRTQEIGVRMAIGGTPGDILRLVFAQGMRPLALGVAIGCQSHSASRMSCPPRWSECRRAIR